MFPGDRQAVTRAFDPPLSPAWRAYLRQFDRYLAACTNGDQREQRRARLSMRAHCDANLGTTADERADARRYDTERTTRRRAA